jgi:VanZ family protein
MVGYPPGAPQGWSARAPYGEVRPFRGWADGSVGGCMAQPRADQVAPRLLDAGLWIGAAVAGILVVLYSLSAIPPGIQAFSGADKAGHAAVCFSTVLLLLFAAVWRPGRGRGRFPGATPLIVVGLVVAGIVLELLQATFTERSAEVLDVVMETFGALAALGVFTLLRRQA